MLLAIQYNIGALGLSSFVVGKQILKDIECFLRLITLLSSISIDSLNVLIVWCYFVPFSLAEKNKGIIE